MGERSQPGALLRLDRGTDHEDKASAAARHGACFGLKPQTHSYEPSRLYASFPRPCIPEAGVANNPPARYSACCPSSHNRKPPSKDRFAGMIQDGIQWVGQASSKQGHATRSAKSPGTPCLRPVDDASAVVEDEVLSGGLQDPLGQGDAIRLAAGQSASDTSSRAPQSRSEVRDDLGRDEDAQRMVSRPPV
jgi:hypothetical protein